MWCSHRFAEKMVITTWPSCVYAESLCVYIALCSVVRVLKVVKGEMLGISERERKKTERGFCLIHPRLVFRRLGPNVNFQLFIDSPKSICYEL